MEMTTNDARTLVHWACKFAEANRIYDVRYNSNVMMNFAVSVIALGIDVNTIIDVDGYTITTRTAEGEETHEI